MSSSQLEQGTENKIKELDQNEIDLAQDESSNAPQTLMFSTLGEQPRTSSYDPFDSDMAMPTMASGTSAVYSPFFLQMFSTERRGIDSGKLYPRDFTDSKHSGTFCLSLRRRHRHKRKTRSPARSPGQCRAGEQVAGRPDVCDDRKQPFFLRVSGAARPRQPVSKARGRVHAPPLLPPQTRHVSTFPRFHVVTTRRSARTRSVRSASCCVRCF